MRAGEGGKGGGTKVTDEVNVTHVIKVECMFALLSGAG